MSGIILLAVMAVMFAVVIFVILKISKGRGGDEALQRYIRESEESNRRNMEMMSQRHTADMEMMSQRHTAELEMLTRRHEEQVNTLSRQWEERMQEMDRRSRESFKLLSQEVLDGSVSMLRGANAEQMDSVMKPMRERVDSLSQLVHRIEVQNSASRQSLDDRLEQLAGLNRSIGEEAKALTRALRGNSKVQGDWGETVLQTILEKAGLQEGVNFRAQPGGDESGSYRGEEGNLLRPDFVIDLPDGRHVVVDSKVSLTDYVRYCEADTEEERKKCARRHVDSVRKHIKELDTKRYQKAVSGALEHVLMFIPNEGAYLCALQEDADLWKYAYDSNVVIVSAAHLMSVVQLIGQLWREERQDRNAAEIARIAGLLYDSMADFTTRLRKVGASIDASRKVYEETAQMLDDGRPRSILARARKLRELGAKTGKTIAE